MRGGRKTVIEPHRHEGLFTLSNINIFDSHSLLIKKFTCAISTVVYSVLSFYLICHTFRKFVKEPSSSYKDVMRYVNVVMNYLCYYL